ncbi:MAG: LytTR family DNA-binding domain-containing protein [Staphylococcus sp.]|nr:LytTR family DNA-binding domain-containing protein [Anaeroplasma bactoclasticum]MCM1195707.1 LytTR family DNA-binding domain-containing protein [Roseburia sp.]MCM1261044.1 LytTR family DNA-binding domain-containing protein [Staphylococcus sp.]MCM1556373.1 LytTR family DNA-binding domain-containing protein [Anaeroplasma bactoclasticum]
MNILILDDNIDVAENLSLKIKNLFPNFSIQCYNSVNKFLLDVATINSAILFIDVFITRTSGIVLSKDIVAKNNSLPIILYSGKPRETFDVYEGSHVYFLEKPFELSKIEKAIKIAIEHLQNDFFSFSFAGKKNIISLKSIIYFESSARIISILTTREKQHFYGKLDDIEEKCNGLFIRVSKSFLVNPNFIEQVTDNKIYLKKNITTEVLPIISISRQYKRKVMQHELFIPYN